MALGIPIVWQKNHSAAIQEAERESAAASALHAKIDEAAKRDLPSVRERAQLLSNDLKSHAYEQRQAKARSSAVELFAFRDAVLDVSQDFARHAISDSELMVKLSIGYLDLDVFADALDRMIQEADDRQTATQQLRAAAERQEAFLKVFETDRRNGLLRDLYKVQGVVAGITSKYHKAMSSHAFKSQLLCVEMTADEAYALREIEQDAISAYRDNCENEIMFLIRAFRQAGIEDVPELMEAMVGGGSSVKEIDAITKGLALTTDKIRVLDDW